MEKNNKAKLPEIDIEKVQKTIETVSLIFKDEQLSIIEVGLVLQALNDTRTTMAVQRMQGITDEDRAYWERR
jgi:hypothetical protein